MLYELVVRYATRRSDDERSLSDRIIFEAPSDVSAKAYFDSDIWTEKYVEFESFFVRLIRIDNPQTLNSEGHLIKARHETTLARRAWPVQEEFPPDPVDRYKQ